MVSDFSFRSYIFSHKKTKNDPDLIESKIVKKIFGDLKLSKKKASAPTNTRYDVLHKTLLRVVKKYYNETCWDNKYNFGQAKNQKCGILENVDRIWEQRFKKYFSEEEIAKTAPLSLLVTSRKELDKYPVTEFFMVKIMVACITARGIMKRYVWRYEVRKAFNKYYNTLTKYSSITLHSLLAFKPFVTVFKEFLASEDFSRMMKTDETLTKNRELYVEKVAELSLIMDNSTLTN